MAEDSSRGAAQIAPVLGLIPKFAVALAHQLAPPPLLPYLPRAACPAAWQGMGIWHLSEAVVNHPQHLLWRRGRRQEQSPRGFQAWLGSVVKKGCELVPRQGGETLVPPPLCSPGLLVPPRCGFAIPRARCHPALGHGRKPWCPSMPRSACPVAPSWALLRSNNLALALKRIWGTVYLGDEAHYLFMSHSELVQHPWQGMAGLPSPLSHACSRQPRA